MRPWMISSPPTVITRADSKRVAVLALMLDQASCAPSNWFCSTTEPKLPCHWLRKSNSSPDAFSVSIVLMPCSARP